MQSSPNVVANTYSLRARKQTAIDRDWSPTPSGQPSRKKAKLQQNNNGTPVKRGRPPNADKGIHKSQKPKDAAPKFAVPAPTDPYFIALRTGKNPNALVDKWIKEYENSPDQAIVSILRLIIASSGCSGPLDANMVHNMEWRDIIQRLTDYFDEESGDYPLVLANAPYRKFRGNLADFLTLFVIKCKESILFDVTLMDNLIQLLTQLSDNGIRAFRHTATFAAMKISSAIVDVVVELASLKSKNTIQIETEKERLNQQAGTNERLELLLQTKAELDQKIDELSAMLQYMFKSVFVHRYRDQVFDIRIICVTELGNWVRVYPDSFLDDSYLKYIGWSLFDKMSEVRLKCVSSLLPLYENMELIGRLELFTHKFKDRLVSMVLDVDVEVATKSCQLMTHIYRAFPTLLDPGACVPLYELVYCNNRQLACAAGEFINTKLFSAAVYRADASHAPPENRELIKDLVAFYVDGGVHQYPAYLVDSLIDMCPMLKDWQTMVDILLSDDFDQFDAQLITIVCSAVKQAATGEHPTNRIVISIRRGPGAGTEKKDLKGLHEERIRISEVFIPALPKLLDKFIADQEKVANLLEVFLQFDLDIYMAGRHEQPLYDLMVMIERIVDQHSDDGTLVNCSLIFKALVSNRATAQFTETQRTMVIDKITNVMQQQLQTFAANDDDEQLDQEDEAALLSSFRKMVAFTASVDIGTKCDIWDLIMNLLQSGDRFQSADLSEKAVLLCFQLLSWDTRRLVASEEWKEEAIELLRRRRDQFLKIIRIILRESVDGVENAFLCLCDTLIMFNWKLAADLHDDHPISRLALRTDREMSQSIIRFIMDNVFVSEENQNFLGEHEHIQLTQKRRNILAQYSKLYLYGVLPIIEIAAILRYFTRYYTDYGDILKHLLQKCRELDKATTAKAIVDALLRNFHELKIGNPVGTVDQDSESFQALRELAKRFALSFGVDNIKNREALAMIHHDGIKYALQLDNVERRESLEENMAFFEVLQEFSPKLHRQDKLAVLRYLDKHCPPEVRREDDESWQTFILYRNSLAKAE